MGDRAATTVERTMVPPVRTTTAPSACLATFPVSIDNDTALIGVCTEWGIRSATSSGYDEFLQVGFRDGTRPNAGEGAGNPVGVRRHRRIPSFSVNVPYRSGFFLRRYSSNPRRLPISISSPRREWGSFWWGLK